MVLIGTWTKKNMSCSVIWLQECAVRSTRHERALQAIQSYGTCGWHTSVPSHSLLPVSNNHSLSQTPLHLGNATWHSYTQKAFVTGEKMLLLWAAPLFLLPWEWCDARSYSSLRGSHLALIRKGQENWGLLTLTTPHWADDSTPSTAHFQPSYCVRNINPYLFKNTFSKSFAACIHQLTQCWDRPLLY